MRSALLLLFSLVLSAYSWAQCPEFRLQDLQSLQNSADSDKEAWLRGHGFDLASRTGATFRYNKCWNGYHGSKTVYLQVIFWNTDSGSITFLCPDQEAFQALRGAIEGRHGQTGTLGSSDVIIGQKFRYNFGSQYLDGVMHWSVAISLK
ncbi:MAG: hypothetical protein JNJ57_04975 [Saprospiraceae bacterium]|nr:hypothetical protein [Saprospiraceae bacterium]